MKLVLILAVARFFWGLAGRELSWADIAKAFAMIGVPMLLVLQQPDLGTALTYFPVLVAGLFLGGIRPRQALLLLLGFSILVSGAWMSGKRLKPYQMARLTSFIDPGSDPRGAGYQILQSKIAVGWADCGAREPTRERRPKATSCPFRTPTSSSPPSARSTASPAAWASCCCTS